MRILVTGGTGFIGEALLPVLKSAGHELVVLTRQKGVTGRWAEYVNELDAISDPIDAVINLAGASLAGKRWTERYKAEIVASRVRFTDELVHWMGRQEAPPQTLISGSAIGYYGEGDQDSPFTEESPGGAGFAASLCEQWESAAQLAEQFGTRIVTLRLGVVLGRGGGALTELLRSFQFGVGSWPGDGYQILSWVHRSDVVSAIEFLLAHGELSGPFNVTAPQPVSYREFAEIAASRKRVLLKLGLPSVMAKLLLGEMAEELLLSGQKVLPMRLQAAGFDFRFESLDSAFVDLISRSGQ